MDISEKRIIGALLLLLGFSFLTVGFYAGHLDIVKQLMTTIYGPAMAGVP
jgi:hypothetical protein